MPGSAKSSGSSKSSGPTPSSATQSIVANNNEKTKVIIKQKNQGAQKNVNLFLLNIRMKTKKGKITSFGFGVAEEKKWIFRGV